MSEAKILPNDKPQCCSRCGVPLGKQVVVLEWNGLNFQYCPTCQPGGAK